MNMTRRGAATQSPEPVVVVPREPTEAMIAAGSQAASQCGGWIGDGRLVRAYRAMISAAPVSPDSDLLKEAVGLLRSFDDEWNSGLGWAVRMDDLGCEVRAFLAKLGRA